MLMVSMVAGSNMSMTATMWNNHLKDNNLGYWEHWWRAMKCSLALFIHAWYPNILEDYASKELQND